MQGQVGTGSGIAGWVAEGVEQARSGLESEPHYPVATSRVHKMRGSADVCTGFVMPQVWPMHSSKHKGWGKLVAASVQPLPHKRLKWIHSNHWPFKNLIELVLSLPSQTACLPEWNWMNQNISQIHKSCSFVSRLLERTGIHLSIII